MNDEVLIEAVRENVEIYDLSHPRYNDANFKEGLWNEIGKQMNRTGISCKNRWNNIRDNYRKSLRKSKSMSSNHRKYKYADQLYFLSPYFQERDSFNCLSLIENSQTNSDNEIIDEEKHIIDNDENIDYETVLASKKQKLVLSPGTLAEKKTTDTSIATLMEYFTEKNKHMENASKPPDPVDAFLAGIAPTLKTFPPYFLNVAKSRIFSIVQEIELNLIMERPMSLAATHPVTASPMSSQS